MKLLRALFVVVASSAWMLAAAEAPACRVGSETPLGTPLQRVESPCGALSARGPNDKALPPQVQRAIAALEISQMERGAVHRELVRVRDEIRAAPESARPPRLQALRKRINASVAEAETRRILRAVYAPDPLPEALTWFWFNHFNVFALKGDLGAYLADYEEQAIRPHVLGRFRDMVMATLKHPAMLIYLDNDRNVKGKGNENYARELLELHTLGVDGGYTQSDVQELARILTGAGIARTEPKWPPKMAPLVRREGAFLFDPRKHDFGDKILLGRRIPGSGFDEVETVVDMLARHPATARHISRKLAVYFHSDEPPVSLIEAGATAFLASDGNLAATLEAILGSPDYSNVPRRKFKDPYQFVVSSARTIGAAGGMIEPERLVRWINALGQPIYRHSTPNGYGMRERDWMSASQMARRFELATPMARFLAKGREADPVDQQLSPQTRAVLAQAGTPLERRALFLSSPEFMYW